MIVIGANIRRGSRDGRLLLCKPCPADAKPINIDNSDIALGCIFGIKADSIQSVDEQSAVCRTGLAAPSIRDGQGNLTVGTAL